MTRCSSEAAAGVFSADVDKPAAGVLSNGLGDVALSVLDVGVAPAGGASALPNMIGRPSLPRLKITTL
jgi:hypothetical protein